jgi:molecular chaperone GrpE
MFNRSGLRRPAMSLGECQSALEKAQQEAAELHDKYIRAAAAIDNIRKNTERDIQLRVTERVRGFSLRLLDVADNLERALAHAPEESPLRSGVEATWQQLQAALRQEGVEAMEVEPGTPFDPNYHEAIAGNPANIDVDTVTNVAQTGYTLDGQVLRPARVIVATPRRVD